MVALKPVLVGLAMALVGSLQGPVQGMEPQGMAASEIGSQTVSRAAELNGVEAVSNGQRPGQFPGLRGEELAVSDSATLLRQSEVVVRERCTYRPLFEQRLAFDCEAVVLPANVGGGPEAAGIPELGGVDLERLDAGLDLEGLPLNSASDSPDPLGLGVQLRL